MSVFSHAVGPHAYPGLRLDAIVSELSLSPIGGCHTAFSLSPLIELPGHAAGAWLVVFELISESLLVCTIKLYCKNGCKYIA